MKYYKCIVCQETFQWGKNNDPTRCLVCGSEGKVGEQLIALAALRMVLKDETGRKVYFYKNKIVGRDDLRIFDNYKYVSKQQFKVVRDEQTGWTIEALESVVNPLYINKKRIEAGEICKLDSDKTYELLIGNIESGVGLKLKVVFE